MSRPWLSVLIPTFNGERYLPNALDSLLAKDHDGIEVIVVDDGSTDHTLSILEQYASRLNLRLESRAHVGNWVESTNAALASARGEYVSILHQDDLWLPARAKEVRAELERHRPALLVHGVRYIDNVGRAVGQLTCPLPEGVDIAPSFVVERLLTQNFVPLPGATFPRRFAAELGGLDPHLWYTADWDLWLKLATRGPVRYLARPLAAYRVHHQAQTATRSSDADGFRAQLTRVLERHLPSAPLNGGGHHVAKAARFSVEVNVALASFAHHRNAQLGHLVTGFIKLGPAGQRRYLRDSRIRERFAARVRVGIGRG